MMALRLSREQCRHSVLWLPLRGMTKERINGRAWLAEPGQGLLFQPGDAMVGETSDELEGLSILIPAALLEPPESPVSPPPVSPLLDAGPLQQAILASARRARSRPAQRGAAALDGLAAAAHKA